MAMYAFTSLSRACRSCLRRGRLDRNHALLSPLRQSGYPGPVLVDATSLILQAALCHMLACSRLKLLPMRSPVGSPPAPHEPQALRCTSSQNRQPERAHLLSDAFQLQDPRNLRTDSRPELGTTPFGLIVSSACCSTRRCSSRPRSEKTAPWHLHRHRDPETRQLSSGGRLGSLCENSKTCLSSRARSRPDSHAVVSPPALSWKSGCGGISTCTAGL